MRCAPLRAKLLDFLAVFILVAGIIAGIYSWALLINEDLRFASIPITIVATMWALTRLLSRFIV